MQSSREHLRGLATSAPSSTSGGPLGAAPAEPAAPATTSQGCSSAPASTKQMWAGSSCPAASSCLPRVSMAASSPGVRLAAMTARWRRQLAAPAGLPAAGLNTPLCGQLLSAAGYGGPDAPPAAGAAAAAAARGRSGEAPPSSSSSVCRGLPSAMHCSAMVAAAAADAASPSRRDSRSATGQSWESSANLAAERWPGSSSHKTVQEGHRGA